MLPGRKEIPWSGPPSGEKNWMGSPFQSVRVLEIEQKIDNLRPDFFEAEEILQALEAALRARYDHALLDDISHYVTALGKALMRAEDEYTSE